MTENQWRALLAGTLPHVAAAAPPPGMSREACTGWELTLAAPPSVSTLYAAGNGIARRILAALQEEALEHTLECLEQVPAFRQPGSGDPELPTRLLAAAFLHDTTEDLTPDLHHHLLIFGGAPAADGAWRPLDGNALSQYLPALAAVYHYALDGLLVHVGGLHTERDGDSIRIYGVPPELVQALTVTHGESRSLLPGLTHHVTQAVEWIARHLLPHRPADAPPERYARWAAVGREYGLTQEDVLNRLHYVEPSPQIQEEFSLYPPGEQDSGFRGRYLYMDAMRRCDFAAALERAVGNAAVELQAFSEPHLIRSLAEACQDRHLGPLPVWSTVRRHLGKEPSPRWNDPNLSQRAYSIREAVSIEQESPERGEPSQTARELRQEERAALLTLTEDPGRIKALYGFPEAPMMQILQLAHEFWTASPDGYQVIGTTHPTGGERGLEQQTGIHCIPLERLLRLIGQTNFPLDEKTILVVDEVYPCSPSTLSRLVEVLDKAGATLVLAGERALSPLLHAGVVTAAYPKEAWVREAVRAAGEGRTAGVLAAYDQHGLLHAAGSRVDCLHGLLLQWQREGVEDPQAHVMFTTTREEALALNRAAQALRQAAGALGPEHVTVNGTEIHTNDRVLFTQMSHSLRVFPGATGTVQAVMPNAECLLVKLEDGRTELIPARETQGVELGYAVPTEVAHDKKVTHAYVLLGGPRQSRQVTGAQLSHAIQATHLFIDTEPSGMDLEVPECPLEVPCEQEPAAEPLAPEIELEDDYDLSPER